MTNTALTPPFASCKYRTRVVVSSGRKVSCRNISTRQYIQVVILISTQYLLIDFSHSSKSKSHAPRVIRGLKAGNSVLIIARGSRDILSLIYTYYYQLICQLLLLLTVLYGFRDVCHVFNLEKSVENDKSTFHSGLCHNEHACLSHKCMCKDMDQFFPSFSPLLLP